MLDFNVQSLSTAHFWATVSKTVRPCYRTVVLSVCLSCLFVTLAEAAGWIKMPLGTESAQAKSC